MFYETNMPRTRKSSSSSTPTPDTSYSNPSYWNSRSNLIHEWYYSYKHLQPLIDQTLSSILSPPAISPSVTPIYLEIGCGNIPLIQTMINDPQIPPGKFIGIDFSSSIIDLLNNNLSSTERREGSKQEVEVQSNTITTSSRTSPPSSSPTSSLEYQQMDARSLKYSTNSINFIVDKGTIDAMLCSTNWKKNIHSIISEMCRVLCDNGAIMIVSHLHYESDAFQQILYDIIQPIFLSDDYYQRSWNIEIHCSERIHEEVQDDKGMTENATVYILKSSLKRYTRSVLKRKKEKFLRMEVFTYEVEGTEEEEEVKQEEEKEEVVVEERNQETRKSQRGKKQKK